MATEAAPALFPLCQTFLSHVCRLPPVECGNDETKETGTHTHTHTQATDRDGAIRRKQDRGQTRGEKETAGKTETTAQMEASNKTVYCMDTAALAKTTVAATMHCKKNMLIKAPIIIRVPLPKAHEKNLERAAPFSYSKRRNP